ncbi:unnamed protein product [Dracunculus medinensis]|uniref:Uncharacterized protein n=1 Tax=Dracunculus medinensis TaxID=318479 RepID=A0A0N4UN72_DRAME|nr:unnamed protein product [Dracunculus medinensis]
MSHISVNLNGRSTSNETIDGTLQSECQNVPFSSSTKSESETLNLKRNFKENCSLHRISFNWRKKEKFDTSLLRAHQRSRSADGENIYSIKFSCTSPLLRGETQWLSKNAQANNSSINALKATKNFFKRLYNSATLPVRSNKPVISKALVDSSLNGPQFEIRNSSNVNNEEEEQRYCEYEVNQDSTTCITTDNESISSTIKDIADEPMNDSVFRKSFNSTCSSNFSADFHSWSEFFDHLRKEIANMRERDAQILADLRRVEIQLENVKNRAMCSSKSNYELDRRKPKLGDLVESMPL